jgi:Zn-dependent peptidase ImmA (M78 family)
LHDNNQLFVDKVFAIKLRDHHSSEAVSIEEIEANAFAAELLMPTGMILGEIQSVSEILDSEENDLDNLIKKLANKFKVSQQAMTIRLMNLGVIQNTI